ncbi:MAG: glycosyltransferase [Bacteroidaceae bacterium]|nr:glycosyltransferase [Bacteroidaceae bacterium]
MRILHIHPSMLGGGIESVICSIAGEMARQGHDVTVCSIYRPKQDDIFWYQLPENVRRDTLGKETTGFSLREVFAVYRYIRRGHFDVVQLHGFLYYFFFAVVMLPRQRFFYTFHSDARRENFKWDARFFPLKKLVFRLGLVRAITISPASQQSFRDLYGCSSSLCENGIPMPAVDDSPNVVDEARLTPSTRVFLHPGRITEAKNQLVLVRVFRRLIEEGQDVVLLIVGKEEDDVILQQLRPYFSDRIRYLGLRTDVPSLLARADAMCLPSVWEGLPITLLECLAVGCIPVCSPVGGIVNVVEDGRNGLLSASSAEDDYYRVMRRFLVLDADGAARMKQQVRASFQPYHISHTVEKYLAAYAAAGK